MISIFKARNWSIKKQHTIPSTTNQ